MRIGITCYPTYGGSGTVATELGKALAARGHTVHFISHDIPYRLHGFDERIFFHHADMPSYPLFDYPPYLLALATKMVEVAESEDLDILHVHYAIPHATSAYLAKQMLSERDLKVITTLHGTDITLVGNDESFFRITRFSIEQSDGVTAVSDYLRRETMKTFGGLIPIEVIPNFVNVERFKPGASCCAQSRFAPQGECIVMHISNFRPVKRVLDVVAIFAKIRKALPAKLLMIGDGPTLGCARREASRLRMNEDVIFLGRQRDVEGLLPLADLFLFPSDGESFGLAALEAMSCGVPVIGAHAGGLPEVVLHGETGYLADVGDVNTMAAYAQIILRDKALRERLGKAAREVAEDRFEEGKVVEQYEGYYRDVLDGRA